MKSHRDHRYCPGKARSKVRRQAATYSTKLMRMPTGELAVAIPQALLGELKLGTRLWLQLLHHAIWFTRTPIGPRDSHRTSRRTRRGPRVRILRTRCARAPRAFRLTPLRNRHGPGGTP